MDIRLKRVYEPAAASDGDRILIDRIWPRGVTREEALQPCPRLLHRLETVQFWIRKTRPRIEGKLAAVGADIDDRFVAQGER